MNPCSAQIKDRCHPPQERRPAVLFWNQWSHTVTDMAQAMAEAKEFRGNDGPHAKSPTQSDFCGMPMR
jgi:hypothetical protein